MALLACPPQRTDDRGGAPQEPARSCQHPRLIKNLRRIGLVVVPPEEELPWAVDRYAEQDGPRRTKLGLIAEHRGRPLRCRPQAEDDNGEDDEYLSDKELCGGHGPRSDSRAAG